MKPQLEKRDFYGTSECKAKTVCSSCVWFYREKCQREGLLLEGKEK